MYEKAYEMAFKKGIVAKALVSRDGNFIAANETYCRLTEYTEFELQRKSFASITDPEDVNVDVYESKRVAEGAIESYEMIKSYITKTKKLVKVRLRVDGVRDDAGNFVCFLAQAVPLFNDVNLTSESVDIKAAKILTWTQRHSKLLLFILTGLAALGYFIKELLTYR